MPSRSYGQHCAVAKCLDLVGDRWNLLIIRELLDGPQRYGDLHAGLAPIATDMLAGRLRDLERAGLVRKGDLPMPATGSAYELTDDGLALEDVVNAMARWGRPLMASLQPGDIVRPVWLVRALRATVRAERNGPALVVRLALPEGGATIRIGSDGVDAVGDDAAVDVTLTGQADVLVAALDPGRAQELVAAGRLHIAGNPQQLDRFTNIVEQQQVQSSVVQ
jgi:DNA-binding HxlR family transcriptional regulator